MNPHGRALLELRTAAGSFSFGRQSRDRCAYESVADRNWSKWSQ